jgi:hypothetical protein
MNRSIATRLTTIVLAATLTLAMLGATNALASHQYRVSATAGERSAPVAEQVQRVTAAAHRDTAA